MSGESDDWADFGSSNDAGAGDDSWADFEAAPPVSNVSSSIEATDKVNSVESPSESVEEDNFEPHQQTVDFPSPAVRLTFSND